MLLPCMLMLCALLALVAPVNNIAALDVRRALLADVSSLVGVDQAVFANAT